MYKIALIGAMFGDEGKGLMTDYFCNKLLNYGLRNGAVVRFQGGAQAGHTVVTPDGHRHIFSHFGSGTFLGVKTILSSNFVCNPMLFLTEFDEFSKSLKHKAVQISVEKDSYITTVYDIWLNQQTEMNRYNARHGSVGVGFGETIERNEQNIRLTYKDLFDINLLKKILEDIRCYFIETCKARNILIRDWMLKDQTNNMLTCFGRFKALTSLYEPNKSLDFVIFEGSQGLGLDMEYGYFPHVTRSKTGVKHAKHFCSYHNIGSLDEVYYITRSYTTRHGAGPLSCEGIGDFNHIIDETNKENHFQGKLRFAPLDIHDINKFIKFDNIETNYNTKLVVTCMDQIRDGWRVQNRSELGLNFMAYSCEVFDELMRNNANILSYGPRRIDVVEISNKKFNNLEL